MTMPIPGGPTQAGVNDQSGQPGAIEIHTADGPATSPTTGTQLKQQVIQVQGFEALLACMERMEHRLQAIEHELCGYSEP